MSINPVQYNIPSGYEFKNVSVNNFKGINCSDNPFEGDLAGCQNSTNLYINENNTLAVRPRLHFEKIRKNIKEIKKVTQLTDSKTIAMYEDNNGKSWTIFLEDSDNITTHDASALVSEDIHEASFFLYGDGSIMATNHKGWFVLDTDDNKWKSIFDDKFKDKIYTPIVKTNVTTGDDTTGNLAEYVNSLSNEYKYSYAFDPFTTKVSEEALQTGIDFSKIAKESKTSDFNACIIPDISSNTYAMLSVPTSKGSVLVFDEFDSENSSGYTFVTQRHIRFVLRDEKSQVRHIKTISIDRYTSPNLTVINNDYLTTTPLNHNTVFVDEHANDSLIDIYTAFVSSENISEHKVSLDILKITLNTTKWEMQTNTHRMTVKNVTGPLEVVFFKRNSIVQCVACCYGLYSQHVRISDLFTPITDNIDEISLKKYGNEPTMNDTRIISLGYVEYDNKSSCLLMIFDDRESAGGMIVKCSLTGNSLTTVTLHTLNAGKNTALIGYDSNELALVERDDNYVPWAVDNNRPYLLVTCNAPEQKTGRIYLYNLVNDSGHWTDTRDAGSIKILNDNAAAIKIITEENEDKFHNNIFMTSSIRNNTESAFIPLYESNIIKDQQYIHAYKTTWGWFIDRRDYYTIKYTFNALAIIEQPSLGSYRLIDISNIYELQLLHDNLESGVTKTVVNDKKIDPKFKNIRLFNNRWFLYNELDTPNKIWYTANSSDWYLPEFNYLDIGKNTPIVDIIPISNTQLAVFKTDETTIITEQDGAWVTNTLKTQKGTLGENQATIIPTTNVPVVINDDSISILVQSDNAVSEDSIFTIITDNIFEKFSIIKDKSKIKTHKHGSYIYFWYVNDTSTDVWVLDCRLMEWFKWILPVKVDTMYESQTTLSDTQETETKIIVGDKEYSLTTAGLEIDNNQDEYNEISYAYLDVLGNSQYRRIPWDWKSRINPLGTNKYLKKINNIHFTFADKMRAYNYTTNTNGKKVVVDSTITKNNPIVYELKTYRKKSKFLNGDFVGELDGVGVQRIKIRMPKCDFAELTLSNYKIDGNDILMYYGVNGFSETPDSQKYIDSGINGVYDRLNLIDITYKVLYSEGVN